MASPFNPVPLTVPKAPVQPFTAMEQWQEFFARLGMTRVLESQGPSVEEMTRRLCHRKAKDDLRRFHRPQETHVQVWLGDKGVVGVLECFRSSEAPWSLSSVRLEALAVLPHGAVETGPMVRGARVVSDGRAIQKLRWTKGDQEPLDECLQSWKAAAQEGRLVPLEQWPVLQRKASFEVLEALESGVGAWAKVGLDWTQQPVLSKATFIPAEVSRLAARTQRQALPALGAALGQQVTSLPVHLQEMFHRLLASRHDALSLTLNKPRPAEQKRYWRQQVSTLANKKLNQISPVTPFLSSQQRSVIEGWVNALASDTETSVKTWAKLPLFLPGVAGVSALDLALSVARHTKLNMPWDKVVRAIEKCPKHDLKDLVEGKKGRYPLALAIAKTVLNVPNRGVDADRFKQSNEKAFRALDHLIERVGSDGLVWETPTVNVWGWALGWDANLPGDEDLCQQQNLQLNAFMAWAESRQVQLPVTVRFQSSEDYQHHRSRTIDLAPHDQKAFMAAWPTAARAASIQEGAAHWELLAPLRARWLERHLSDALPQPSRSLRPRF